MFLEAVSPDSIAFRFFGTPNRDWVVSWSLDVDYADRFALIAESGLHRGSSLTPPSYGSMTNRRRRRSVADAWQGRGI